MNRSAKKTNPNPSLTEALLALIEVKVVDFFDDNFGPVRGIAILASVWTMFAVGALFVITMVAMSLTYLVTESAHAVAVTALVLGTTFTVFITLFFSRVLRKSYWSKLMAPPSFLSESSEESLMKNETATSFQSSEPLEDESKVSTEKITNQKFNEFN